MEKIIDRKEFRRNNDFKISKEDTSLFEFKKRIKNFLIKILIASIVILIIAFLRLFKCEKILNNLNRYLKNEINVSSFLIYIDNITKEFKKNLNNIEDTEKINNEEINNIKNNEEKIKYINKAIYESGENKEKYIIAIEGINQMSDDVKEINKKYKLGLPVVGTVTSRFGVRNSKNPQVSPYHSGIDIAANTGTEILSALDGEVIKSSFDTYYGNFLKVQNGDLIIIYAHCSKLLVKAGDKIKKGQKIAYVGNTGNSTGPHLHFEVRYNGRLVNPDKLIEF